MAGNFNQNIVAEFAQDGTSVDTANGDNFTINRACAVYDAYAVAHGATAGTVDIFKGDDSGGNEITSQLSVNAADQTLARPPSIDNDKHSCSSGDILCIKKSPQVSTSTFIYFNATGVTLS